MRGATGCLLLFTLISCSLADVRISLDSDSWSLQNANKSIQATAKVPGGVYTDLQRAGILNGTLFYRFNDHDFRWVAKDNWTFSYTFDIPQEILNKNVVNLVFHGVDTLGEIVLNGKSLGNVDNMFVRYVFPIKDVAKETGNTLEVRLRSAVTEAAALAQAQPYKIPPDCVPNEYQGECHANMVRKMQATFSWDWGPAFPSQGIWKSVEVEGIDAAVVRDLTVVTEKIMVENIVSWKLTVTIYAELGTETFNGLPIAILTLLDNNSRKIEPKSKKSTNMQNENFLYVSSEEFIFEESEIQTWWPNGFGAQPLYSLNVTLISFDSEEEVSKSIRIGFRTVELIQESLAPQTTGLSFYFKVNGVPIFAKGSNWIPGHVLPELGAEPNMLRHVLTSAKETHMNMLRVWGGGVYESDLFYQLADELGLLIWQDMMFACAMYPTGDAYFASVRTEIEQQVKRLQFHPSVAIWAGNNENEAALRGDWYGTNSQFEQYRADYIKLYVGLIKPLVQDLDSSRSYVVSSPSNGVNSEDQGFVADNPYSPLYGDVHYYNYASDGWDSFTFPDTRFASEYGYQAMPSFVSLQTVSEASDLTLASEFSQQRQHHPGGYIEMAALIKQHLPLPDQDDGSLEYFQKFIYYSQVSQGMSTKTETERYRRDRSKLTSNNRGNTMGALYWQLNDVWEGPTWSSIEFSGRWKLLHYLAKNFFSPILVSPEKTPDGELNVFLVSDLLEDVTNLRIDVSIYSYDSFSPKSVTSSNQTLTAATSTLVWTAPSIDDLLKAANCSANTCFFYFTLSNNSSILSHNAYYPSSFSDVTLPATDIAVTVTTVSETSAVLNITSKAVAPFLWLETEVSGIFEDNGFLMISGQRDLKFETRGETLDLETFQRTLTIRDLSNPIPKKAVSEPNIPYDDLVKEVILVL